jgi:hypothetical protein
MRTIRSGVVLAYRATDYVAFSNGRASIIRIGHHSLVIDALLTRMKARSGAFITAWNPFGKTGIAYVSRTGYVCRSAFPTECYRICIPNTRMLDSGGHSPISPRPSPVKNAKPRALRWPFNSAQRDRTMAQTMFNNYYSVISRRARITAVSTIGLLRLGGCSRGVLPR